MKHNREFEYAGLLDRRAEAAILDAIVVNVAAAVLGYVAGMFLVGGHLAGLGGVFVAVLYGAPVLLLVYHTVLEAVYGKTLDKHARGIAVVSGDGSQVGFVGALLRNVLRVVDALPMMYLVEVVSGYVSDQNKRVGDHISRTVVVRTQ